MFPIDRRFTWCHWNHVMICLFWSRASFIPLDSDFRYFGLCDLQTPNFQFQFPSMTANPKKNKKRVLPHFLIKKYVWVWAPSPGPWQSTRSEWAVSWKYKRHDRSISSAVCLPESCCNLWTFFRETSLQCQHFRVSSFSGEPRATGLTEEGNYSQREARALIHQSDTESSTVINWKCERYILKHVKKKKWRCGQHTWTLEQPDTKQVSVSTTLIPVDRSPSLWTYVRVL